jgi:hypothetical protein
MSTWNLEPAAVRRYSSALFVFRRKKALMIDEVAAHNEKQIALKHSWELKGFLI